MTKHDDWYRFMSTFHKAERERAERCIADIIELLCDHNDTPEQTDEKITTRIIKHYERKE
jgi:hypothetical protein